MDSLHFTRQTEDMVPSNHFLLISFTIIIIIITIMLLLSTPTNTPRFFKNTFTGNYHQLLVDLRVHSPVERLLK